MPVLLESEHACEDVRREGLHGIVQFAGGGIEVAAGSGDLVLDVGDFFLQLEEVLVGLQLRIGLDGDLQSGEGTRQGVLGLDLVVDACGAHRGGTGLCHALQQFLLMLGIALHGGHELGNQVVALLQLHVDVGKGVLSVVTQFDEGVVNADASYNQDCNHY